MSDNLTQTSDVWINLFDLSDGIEIGGKLYNNLRYADDVALLAMTEGKLQELVNDVDKASERFGLSRRLKSWSSADTHLAST